MLALGGRLPTADEFDTVDRLGATGVELVLMNMMKEERFRALKELFNDVLLTDRFWAATTCSSGSIVSATQPTGSRARRSMKT